MPSDPGSRPAPDRATTQATPPEAVLEQLLRRVEALEDDNRRLRAQLGSRPAAAAPTATTDVTEPARVTRRRMLLGGAAAAAVGTATALASAAPAAANSQGQSFTLGDPANTATNTTGVDATAPGGAAIRATNLGLTGFGLLGQSGASSGIATFSAGTVGDSQVYPGVTGVSGNAGGVVGVSGALPPPSAWGPPAGVNGYGQDRVGVFGASITADGMVGTSTSASGVVGRQAATAFTGVAGVKGEAATAPGTIGFSTSKSGVRAASSTGEGIYATSTGNLGGRFSGGRAAINLVPRTVPGPPTTGGHGRGDLVIDNTGTLFICTTSGTPGTWAKVVTEPA